MNSPARTVVLVDGSNAFHMQKKVLGWFFDAVKLLKFLTNGDSLVGAYWFTAIKLNGMDPEKEQGFRTWLTYAGYSIVSKNVKVVRDMNGSEVTMKGNLDIELALTALKTIDYADKYIIVSGDGDFEALVQMLKTLGKQVFIASTQGSCALELRNAAGPSYIELNSIRDLVERQQGEQK